MNKEEFKNAHYEHFRFMLNGDVDDDDIIYINTYARRNPERNRQGEIVGDYSLNPYTYIQYKAGGPWEYNKADYYDEAQKEKWGKEYNFKLIDTPDNEDGKYLIDYGKKGDTKFWIVDRENGVCGAISKTGTNLRHSFGQPAHVVGQPGHAAYLYCTKNNEGKYIWWIGNNISGWSGTEMGERFILDWPANYRKKNSRTFINNRFIGSYMLIGQYGIDHDTELRRVQYLNIISDAYANQGDKEQALYLLEKAREIQPYNLSNFLKLIDLTAEVDDLKLFDLVDKAITGFKYFPMPMNDMLLQIKKKIVRIDEKAELDNLRIEALRNVSKLTNEDYIQCNDAKTVAKYLLGESNNQPVATFSFSGENANCIVLAKEYQNSDIQIRYSIDGGKSFKLSNEGIIRLSEDQIKLINPKDDIIIGIMGTKTNHVIEINDRFTESINYLMFDRGNRVLTGDLAHLVYKTSKDGEYKPYNEGDKIPEGINDIWVKNLAFDSYIEGKEYRVNLNSEKITDVKVLKASSSHWAAAEAPASSLDGNPSTIWHSSYYGDKERYIIYEFDKIQKLSNITLTNRSNGNNGKPKELAVLISTDGENFKEIDRGYNLYIDNKKVTFYFDKNVNAKYVKLQADHTHGGPTDKFFSLAEAEFYKYN